MSSVPEVLDVYYRGISKAIDLDANSELACTLVALAVFKTIDIRDDRLIKQICEVFKINIDNFISNLEYLNEKELIKFFYNKNRVQILDQVLADYLCYKLIIDRQKVSLSHIFSAFFRYYRLKCIDVVKSLVYIYSSDERLLAAIKSLKETIAGIGGIIEFYEIFSGLFTTEAIDYCYAKLNEYDGDMQNSYGDEYCRMIDLLTSHYEYDFKVVDYLLELFKTKNNQRAAILSSIKKNLKISLQSYRDNFKSQIYLLNKCLQSVKEDNEYIELLNNLVELYYPLEHEYSEMQHDKDTNKDMLNIGRFQLPVSVATKELRQLVWRAVKVLYDNRYISKLSMLLDTNAYKSIDKSTLEMDIPFVLDLFEQIDKSTMVGKILCCKLLLAYRQLDEITECFDKIGNSLDIILYKRYVCPIIGVGIFQKENADEFLALLSNYDSYEIEDSIISLFTSCNSHEIYLVNEFTPYAFDLMYERDNDAYIKRVITFLSQAGDSGCEPISILKNINDKESLLAWLSNSDLKSKNTWIAQTYFMLKGSDITKKIADEAFDFFAYEYKNCVWGNERLLNLQEFEKVKPGFCHDLLEVYLNKQDINCYFISTLFNGFNDFNKILELLKNDISLVTKGYFFVLEHESYVDHGGHIASFLIKNDINNLSRLMEFKFKTHDIHINLANFYDEPVFMEKFLACIHDVPYFNYNMYVIEEVKNFSNSMYEQFTNVVVKQYITDMKFLGDISSVICSCNSDRQILFLDKLIKENVDLKVLSELYILENPTSWSGSLVPHIQNNIDALSNYMKAYKNSPIYLPFFHQLLDKLNKLKVAEEVQEYNIQ